MTNYINKIKDNNYYKIIITICGIGFIFLLWFIISISLKTSLFPTIDITFARLGEMLSSSSTWTAIGGTLLRLIICLAISFVLGLIFGIIGGLNKTFYTFLNPLVIVLRTIPAAAFIYIIIVLTRIQIALYLITGLTIFPIIYEAVVTGINGIDKSIFESLQIEGSKYKPYFIRHVYLPTARQNIILGLIQSLGLGMKVTIMSEVICGTDAIPGIGRLIYHGYIDAEMKTVFAATIIAITFTILFDLLLRIERKHIIKIG